MSNRPWSVASPIEGKDKKTFWARVGSAFQRDDGGFNIVLNALPINGKISVFPPQDQQQPARGQRQRDDDVPF